MKYEAVLLNICGYVCFGGVAEVEHSRKTEPLKKCWDSQSPMAHTVFYLRKFHDVQASTQTGI